MNITSIPQVYRNANRWREILSVLSKHGLANWVARVELPTFAKGLLKKRNTDNAGAVGKEQRVRMALEELGPTFIKLGQLLATRPDQVGVELAEELTLLQTAAPADSWEDVRRTIEVDLGSTVEQLYAHFDHQPVASASIGQVHRARMHDGTEVAVKVRHVGIEKRISVDAEILVGLGELAERLPDLQPYRPKATAIELQRSLRRELDLNEERRRMVQFREAFAGDARVRIPRPYAELSSERVLTLEWLDGEKLSSPALAQRPDACLGQLARNGAGVYLDMIFEHGLYHADPHPGNILVLPDGVIGLLDFGMVGRIPDALREDLEDMLMAIVSDDPAMLVSVLGRIGSVPTDLDEAAFTAEVTEFVDHFGRQNLRGFDLAGAMAELIGVLRRRRVLLPPALAMLLKLLVMLEGTARRLEPDFSLLELVAPMQRKMVLRRLSPRRQAKKARRFYGELEQLAEETPRRLREVLSQLQTGTFEVHLDHRGLEPSVNRLVLGLLTSSLVIGSSLMLSNNVLSVYGVSAPGVVGFALSAVLGLRLILAISKSGWIDRD
ncbi:putative protein kinase UbiB [Pseudobythopirellula maris]|uniref:Protein kinase domain-containing protein n=1 Tax=Pseudobythopirellula maris TaxID=2527991 RepID=A0A5C5ZK01_9BACT|nr:AarF/UbiB family protein [Pseudobythopirellula maris]TWT87448.1 putative protein kinase UbiB [Pseudobythopirellula maris]